MLALNAFGVKLGARAITTLAALKLTPLFLLAAFGIFFVDWSQVSFAIDEVPSWGALGASMVLVMFAYSGMETALMPSGEINDPARDVPRATLAAIALVVLLYLALQIVGQGLLGPDLAASGVPVADTAGALWSPGRALLLVTACISMLGFLMGNLLGTARLVFALGRDRYLPRAFGTVSAKHRVPLWALVVHAGLAWALAIAGSFDPLALISGGAICLVYALVEPCGLARAVAGHPRARRSAVQPAGRRADSGHFRGGDGRHRDDAHRARMGGDRNRPCAARRALCVPAAPAFGRSFRLIAQDLARVHDPVRVDRALDGAHEVERGRVLVALELADLELADAVLGADAAAVRARRGRARRGGSSSARSAARRRRRRRARSG